MLHVSSSQFQEAKPAVSIAIIPDGRGLQDTLTARLSSRFRMSPDAQCITRALSGSPAVSGGPGRPAAVSLDESHVVGPVLWCGVAEFGGAGFVMR